MKLVSLLLLLLSLLTFTKTTQSATFKCNTPASCQALVDYTPTNTTTLADIQTLFSVKNFRTIVGANAMTPTTLQNQTILANQTIKIPFPCICSNGTGKSNKRPIYTVQKGDGLDHIARDVFNLLITYQEIADVNNISDVNKIEVGQKLWIPLPCSCDEVDGADVVHYGHVVAGGNTVDGIATQFGTTEATLLKLNGLASPNDLQAGAVLDVPLKTCTSVVNSSSLDYPFLVPNGTYSFTANNCVKCTCSFSSSNSSTLQCEPATNVKVANWAQCPSMQCEGSDNLSLGSVSSSACPRTSCAYAGYNNQSILTKLVNDSTCSNNGASESPGSNAVKSCFQRWSWMWLLVSLSSGVLGFGLLL